MSALSTGDSTRSDNPPKTTPQAQLGRASIHMTVDRYGHLMPDAHVGASERLDATLFGSSPAGLVDTVLTNAPHKEMVRSSMSL